MSKYFLQTFAFLWFVLNTGCVFAQNASMETPTVENTPPAYLFSESAFSADISKKDERGRYLITLNKAEPWVLYFSDRPHRDMGYMSINDFMHFMKKEEKNYEPKGLNAAIISFDKKENANTTKYVFTLHDMNYDRKKSMITFHAEVVPHQNGNLSTILPNTGKINHVALFIDACVGCTPPP
jgi:hypothetical protein